jgi:hypothetical protein
MMFICRWCEKQFGSDLVKDWTPIGDQTFGRQLYHDPVHRLVHELIKGSAAEESSAALDTAGSLDDILAA